MDRTAAQRASARALVLALEGEVADRNSFDLKKAYDQWNRKLFDGELPKIKLRWNRSKRVGGVTKAKRSADGSWEVVEIVISDFAESSAEEIHATLIHEMIHAKLFLDGITEAHGRDFMEERRRVNALVPFDVPVTEDATNKKVSKSIEIQPIGVLYIPESKGAVFYQAKALPQVMQDLDDFPAGWKRAMGPLVFYLVEAREFSKYPLKRKVSRGKFRYYPMAADLIELILSGDKQGEILPEAAAMSRGVAELAVEAAFIALGLRPQPKPSPGEWRRIYDDAKPVKKWRCCSKPKRKTDRAGDVYWGAMCSYKRGNETATVWRKLSEGQKRPNKAVINGKTVKWC